jgi:hypothetical protein
MTTDNRVLYAELQFPVTSNYGSMKKRSQRDSVANTTASTRYSILGLFWFDTQIKSGKVSVD